ncbi:MAG TPA: hypothetical protein VG963_15570, partial [Polyangiaceae bacterium]|nr:hypothetical protein [Polyangiaceae bacterium]
PVASAPVVASGPSAPPPAQRDQRLLWYSLGAGTGAVGAGLLIYGIVRGAATNKCGGDTYCNPSSEHAANHQALAGYVTGGVLLAGSAALFVVGALSGRHQDARMAKTRCGLGLTSAQCTLRF